MRLQLIVALGVGLGLATTALAGGRAGLRLDAYSDPWIDVLLPSVTAHYEGEKLDLDAAAAVDVLSGATPTLTGAVDAVSGATADTVTSATHFSERRGQLDLGVELHPRETWGVSAGYHGSQEPDYQTHTGVVGARTDLFERMSTLSASYGLTLERVGRATDPAFHEGRSQQQLDVGWKQIVDRRTVLSFGLTGNLALCGGTLGCMASAYRYVPVFDDDRRLVAVPEHNPAWLLRGAAGARLARALGPSTAVHLGYRFYTDTWRMTGHTLDAALTRAFAEDRLLLRANVRGSTQRAAAFWRDAYTSDADGGGLTLPVYRSGDRELAGPSSVLVGGRAEWSFYGVGPFTRLSLNARLDRAWYRYARNTELPERGVWLGGAGTEVEF